MNLVDHINLAYDVAYDRYVGRDLALFLLGSWIPDIYICGIFERAETHQGENSSWTTVRGENLASLP